GQLLMGPLARGTRTARPAWFEETPPPPRQFAPGAGNSAGLWVGVIVGMLAGLGAVVAVASMGPAIPLPVRGPLRAALAGVLLAPVLAVGSFLTMLVSPFSLEGILGDGMWSRMAKALHHRRVGPLILPLLVFVVLPMALCGWGGSKMKAINTPMMISAGL